MDNGDATLIDTPVSKMLLRCLQTQEEFPVSGEMTVGRDKRSDIHLDDASISRQHAKLTVIAGAVFVEDLNSTNGTSVNGQKISAPQQLSVGDEVRFHKRAFRLAEIGSGNDEATLFEAVPLPTELKFDPEDAGSPLPPEPALEADGGPPDAIMRPRPERTQTLSPQKLQALAQRATKAKHPITTGKGPRLVILSAPLRGKVFSLPAQLSPGTQLNIGRGGHSNKLNIMLEDKTVSKDHAKLELTPQGWAIMASNARNGLTINGKQTTQSSLSHGDSVTIGRMELLFLTDNQDYASAIDDSGQLQSTPPKGRRMGRFFVFLLALVTVLFAAFFALPLIG